MKKIIYFFCTLFSLVLLNTASFASESIKNTGTSLFETSPINVQGEVISVTCHGGSDGAIYLTITGGTAPYTFQWSNGSTTQDITGLTPGNYSVTVTDEQLVFTTTSFIITQPSMVIGLAGGTIPCSCYNSMDGAINMITYGGTPPYLWFWEDGDTLPNRTGLAAGSYTVNVVDNAGNCSIKTYVVNQPPQIQLTTTVTNVTCFGGNNGTIEVSASEGNPPYVYLWEDGNSSNSRDNLFAGNYQLTVTDANSCTVQTVVQVNQPLQVISTQPLVSNITCNAFNNGSIALNTSGGTPPYFWNWSNSASDENLTNLGPGIYSVTIMDQSGNCTVNNFEITEPPLLTAQSQFENVNCYGNQNGSITLNVNGGTPPLNYLWNDGVTDLNRSNLTPNSYQITITDANGCQYLESFLITQPDSMILNSTITNVSCYQLNTGSIDIEVTGGTTPYIYLWSNGQTTQDISQLTAGSYDVTITDANNCIIIGNYLVTQPDQQLISYTKTDVTCNGYQNGTASVQGTGGTPPYYYTWSDFNTSQSRTNMGPANYSVSITDSHGCNVSTNILIVEPQAINIYSSVSGISCYGSTTGSITINNVTGGSHVYTDYNWSNGETTMGIYNLTAGNYSVTVTDSEGCFGVENYSISQPDQLISNAIVENVTCNNGNNGSIHLNMAGGVPPYFYLWSPALANSPDVENLTSGNYSITVVDNNSCTLIENYSVTQPSPITVTPNLGIVKCFGTNTGSIALEISGGTPPYTFNWSNGETSQNLSNLYAGDYTVNITDANNCQFSQTYSLLENPIIEVNEAMSGVSCNMAADGGIVLSVAGGSGNYTYLWSNNETTKDIYGLSGGTYSVTITDENGCTYTESWTISEPSQMDISVTVQDVLCNGESNGIIDLHVTGGTSPYFYFWSDGASSEDRTGLTANIYQVIVFDEHGCSDTLQIAVNEPEPLFATSDSLLVESCYNGNDAFIHVTPTGGVSPYTFLWNTGSTDANIDNLPAGLYSLTITDANNCAYTYEKTIANPVEIITAVENITPVSCFQGNNGIIEIVAAGGTEPYVYQWSNGGNTAVANNLSAGTYSLTITDSDNHCSVFSYIVNEIQALEVTATTINPVCNGGTTGEILTSVTGGTPPFDYLWENNDITPGRSLLPAGTYSVLITDNNGCTTTGSWTLTQPDAVEINGILTHVSCNGGNDGAIELQVTGGTGNYSYNWDNGDTTAMISGLSAMNYQVTITDEAGCTMDADFTINEPAILTLAMVFDTVLPCYQSTHGYINTLVSGGTEPYTYLWNDGNTDPNRQNLPAGNYSLTVTDDHGCSIDHSVSITDTIQVLVPVETITLVSCPGGNDGSIDLVVSGGVEPYSFVWSNGETSSLLTNLMVGDYSVTISDANGACSENSYSVAQVPEMTATAKITNPICNGGNDASITVYVDNGTPPYTFLWTDDLSDNPERTGLIAGNYSVSVTDFHGCSHTFEFTISQPDPIAIEAEITNLTCFESFDGSIQLTITGGTAPYTQMWDNGSNSDLLDHIAAGTYHVVVTDNNGCVNESSFEVTQPNAITGTLTNFNQTINCSGSNLEPIQFIPDNYQPQEVSYTWYRTNANIAGLPLSGVAPLQGQVINLNTTSETDIIHILPNVGNCVGHEYTATFTVSGALTLNIEHSPILCFGDLSTVTVSGVGGTPPYTGETELTLAAGTYEFSITDANGCITNQTLQLGQPDILLAEAVITPANCSNSSDGSIGLQVSGGTTPYHYIWSDGGTDQNRTGLLAGDYLVTVSDTNGCTQIISATVGYLHEAPTGIIFTNTLACTSVMHPVNIILSGTPPWSFSYTDGYTVANLNNIYTNPYVFNVSLSSNTTFTLLSVNDGYCDGTVLVPMANIVVTPPPTATILPHPATCPGEPTALQVEFTGSNPWSFTWSDGITPHHITGINSSPYEIWVTPTSTRIYTISNVSNDVCNGTILNNQTPLVVYNKPTANISGNYTSCAGENVNVHITLTGTPPWNIVYTDGSMNYTITDIQSTNYLLSVFPVNSVTYQLISVSDYHCSGSVSGNANVLVHPRPTALIDAVSTICIGNTTSLLINLTGTPPWNLVWNNGQTHMVNGITQTPFIIQIQPLTTTTYSITSLQDAFCQNMNPGPAHTVEVIPAPTVSMIAPTLVCYENGGDLTFNFTGTPPWDIIWYDTTQHVVNNIESSPFVLHINPSDITTYWITHVNDQFCNGLVLTSPATVYVNPTPHLELEGFTDQTLCSGTSFQVNALFSNANGPFSLTYLDENQNIITLADLPETYSFQINLPTEPGTYTYEIISISDVNGCINTINRTANITVLESPVVSAGPDFTLVYGNSVTLQGSVLGGTPPYAITWSPSSYLNDPGILNPVCTPLNSMEYTLQVIDNNGCIGTSHAMVNVDVTRSIYGNLYYFNASHTPLNNVKIIIRNNQNTAIDSTLTNNSGFYQFLNLPDGQFHFDIVCNKPFGGVNSTDALIAMKHFVQLTTITGIALKASDVDATGYTNAADALSIARRFTGQILSFPIGDWVFTDVNFTIPTMIPQYDIQALCAGDINGSYLPPLKQQPKLSVEENGLIGFTPGQPFEIPVYISNPSKIGAISLELLYPEQYLKIINVEAGNSQEEFLYNLDNGVLRVAWYGINPIMVDNQQPLFWLKAIMNPGYSSGNSLFEVIGETELADETGLSIENTNLVLPKLVMDHSSFQIGNNYPNPFNTTTQLTILLPESGKLTLEIYNAIGEKVSTSINNQEFVQGLHMITIDGTALPAGLYTYKSIFKGENGSYQASGKLNILR